jgi:hypothetical protein
MPGHRRCYWDFIAAPPVRLHLTTGVDEHASPGSTRTLLADGMSQDCQPYYYDS